MNKTTIEWTDFTWNPVTGCDKISQGCKYCYASVMAKRFWGDRKFTDVQTHKDRLKEPLRFRTKWAGKRVFVCSMSDLFHEDVPFEFIYSVFTRMAMCRETTFQIPTKRIARAVEFYNCLEQRIMDLGYNAELLFSDWPIPNVWIGTSCEDQATADARIPLLLQIPAAVRFLSCEPLIGPLDLIQPLGYPIPGTKDYAPPIQWVICGGESGHGARPMHPDWVRLLRDQCHRAEVPFFFKQWGEYLPYDESGMFYVSSADNETHKEVGFGIKKWMPLLDVAFEKMGKSKSGNLLDGVQHLAFPKP